MAKFRSINHEKFDFLDKRQKNKKFDIPSFLLKCCYRIDRFFFIVASPVAPNCLRFPVFSGHIKEIAEDINLNKAINDVPLMKSILEYHDKQLIAQKRYLACYYLLALCPLAIIFLFVMDWALENLKAFSSNSIFNVLFHLLNRRNEDIQERLALFSLLISCIFYLITILLFVLFVTIVIAIVRKVLENFILRKITTTTCIASAIYIVVELSQPDILIAPYKKANLVNRINNLAKFTMFLPQYYAKAYNHNRYWLDTHFSNMALYIIERGRWAISPVESTLDDLKFDFYRLSEIYISGNYGEFNWISTSLKSDLKPTWKKQFLAITPQFLSILIPLVFLIPPVRSQLHVTGIQDSILSLILIAWLLVSVDAILNLGVIRNFIDLSKGIKDLT